MLKASPGTSSSGASRSAIAARRDVADVDERPPRRAVALQPDRAGRVRPADEVVEDDVEPQTRRDAVDGGVPHRHRRRSPSSASSRSASSARTFDSAYARQRPQRRVLVERGRRRPTAPYMEHDDAKTNRPHARFLRRAGERGGSPSRLMSYVHSALRSPMRVVRECREMDDRVEPAEVRRCDVADVAAQRRDRARRSAPKSHPSVEERVEAGDVVPRRLRAPARGLSRCTRGCPVTRTRIAVGHGAITSFGALKASA